MEWENLTAFCPSTISPNGKTTQRWRFQRPGALLSCETLLFILYEKPRGQLVWLCTKKSMRFSSKLFGQRLENGTIFWPLFKWFGSDGSNTAAWDLMLIEFVEFVYLKLAMSLGHGAGKALNWELFPISENYKTKQWNIYHENTNWCFMSLYLKH